MIGRPISQTQIHIVDEELRPCPSNVAGEILVEGAGLASGYLNRPDLTAERFISGSNSIAPGERLYRMGDIGRRLPDGNIEFLGRIDHQVKIRGHRIELGEIESVLRQHPTIREAVVIARPSAKEDGSEFDQAVTRDQRLVAYVVSDPEPAVIQETSNELEKDVVSEWHNLYDAAYTEDGTAADHLAFEFSIWNSSYTGLPIPADEMRDWQQRTLDRIKSCKLNRVWEIGCGTGLLLLSIAPPVLALPGN